MAGKILNFASSTATYDLTQGYFFYPTGTTPNLYWTTGDNGAKIVPGGDTGMPYTYARLSDDDFDNFIGFGLPSYTPSLSTMSLSADFRITTNNLDADALVFYTVDTSYHGQSGPLSNTPYDWLNLYNNLHLNSPDSCPPASITMGLETYPIQGLGFYFYYKDKNNNYVPLLTGWNPFNYLDGSSHRVLTNISFSGTSLFLNVSAIRYCYGLQASSDSLSNNQWIKTTSVTYTSSFSASNSIIKYFLPRLITGSWVGGLWDTKDISNINFLAYTSNTIKFLENAKPGGQGTSTVKFKSTNRTGGFNFPIQYLVVGGGGGGGGVATDLSTHQGSGGGGGGGVVAGNATITSANTYNISVGGGGNGAYMGLLLGGGTYVQDNTNGGNSSITSSVLGVTAYGGGAGASQVNVSSSINAKAGGSGGGGTGETGYTTGGSSLGGGFAGGTAVVNNFGAAGGGGAASVGSANRAVGSVEYGGDGGAGIASGITGITAYYGGGGGGGVSNNGTNNFYGGAAGVGGGGAGSNGSSANDGQSNTGGGGGGGANSIAGYSPGGNGGSGTVIIALPTRCFSGNVTGNVGITQIGSNTILQFNGSGTYTA
jgi:hypothetical protein